MEWLIVFGTSPLSSLVTLRIKNLKVAEYMQLSVFAENVCWAQTGAEKVTKRSLIQIK